MFTICTVRFIISVDVVVILETHGTDKIRNGDLAVDLRSSFSLEVVVALNVGTCLPSKRNDGNVLVNSGDLETSINGSQDRNK